MKKLIWVFIFLVFHSYSQTPGNGITDIDGNTYNSVIIGTQEWQKENLNVSKYSDGTIIPQVTDPIQWANLTTGAWCYYNNVSSYGPIYGKLYNYYAVAGIYDAASLNNPALRKQLAPQGWHIPSYNDWCTLNSFLDSNSCNISNISGGLLKEVGVTLWTSPNTNATNSSGFSALPGGYRADYGLFSNIGKIGDWWSSTELTQNCWDFCIWYNSSGASLGNMPKWTGYSVRLLNDLMLSNSTLESNRIMLQPNPVKNILNIKTNNDLKNQSYVIFDGLGRVVINGKLNEVDTSINIEQLSKGIYYLKIAENGLTKFIKD